MKLIRSFYARNRSRESAWGNVFNQTSAKLNALYLFLTAIIAPVILTSSLLMTQMVFMVANLLLCLGYLANFVYRIVTKEVSLAEAVIMAIGMAALITACFFIFPMLAELALIPIFIFANHFAVLLNGLFIAREVLVPPLKKGVEAIAAACGRNIHSDFFKKRELTPEQDKHMIHRLLKKHDPNYDTYKSDKTVSLSEKIKPLNKLLKTLANYINKYSEVFLGYVVNKSQIEKMKGWVDDLFERGDTDSSYGFIKRKIDFKEKNCELLHEAEAEIKALIPASPELIAPDWEKTLGQYVKFKAKHYPNPIHACEEALKLVKAQAERQADKLSSLKQCFIIPPP